jgi:hypothetical protein
MASDLQLPNVSVKKLRWKALPERADSAARQLKSGREQ